MKWSTLRNQYPKNKYAFNKNVYSKQRNYCLSHLKQTKKACYAILDEKDLLIGNFGKLLNPYYKTI